MYLILRAELKRSKENSIRYVQIEIQETRINNSLVPYEIQFRAKAKICLVTSSNRIRNASNWTSKTLHLF